MHPVACEIDDPNCNVTKWEHDKNGNVTKEFDPTDTNGTHPRIYNFDNANRLTSLTDRNGRQKTFTYLDNNLVSTEVWKDASNTTVNTITYAYNQNDALTSIGDNNGTITYTYDALDRVSTMQDVWSITQTYGYDAADNPTQVADTKGGTKNYYYDNAERLTKVTYSDTSSQQIGRAHV